MYQSPSIFIEGSDIEHPLGSGIFIANYFANFLNLVFTDIKKGAENQHLYEWEHTGSNRGPSACKADEGVMCFPNLFVLYLLYIF